MSFEDPAYGDIPTEIRPQPIFTELEVEQPPTVAKSVIAVATALGTAIATALADGQVSVWEIVLGALGAVVAGASVWATSNRS